MQVPVSRLVIVGLLLCVPCQASTLFESDTVLTVELAGPLSKVLDDRAEEPEYRAFELRAGGESFAVGVRPRGSSRRAVCRFPPLRLKFDDPDAQSTFAGQTKLKLVTHCNRDSRAEQDALEEYAAYRILNLVTQASFRVRPLRLTYIDTARSQRQPPVKWGFVIEDVDALATRLGGVHVEPRNVKPSDLDPDHATLVGLFQFVIGNTDFVLTARRPGKACCHNAKLIELPSGLLSVPYDFDQAGLVNAAYAGPNPVYDARDVRRRVYRGTCTSLATLQESLVTFEAQRVALHRLFDEVPGMQDLTRKRARSYIAAFYARMDKRGVATLHDRCQ